MDCRRSAVDDVRSRRTRAVDEDRRRIRWAVDEDCHRRRWAIDDDRRRRRREIDDYPPLELPLQWRDPPPEYPPLELPLKWRNPLPDHLFRNQPAAFARDSPSLRPHLVAHDPYAASSRNPTRNPDPLIPDFNSHRRRRNADRAQRRETLRWAQVEASIDRIDAVCSNVLQSVDRIMSMSATIPSSSLIRSTNTQAQSNLLPPAYPPANNHSGADVDSLSTPPATISTPQNPTAIAESTGTEKLLEDVKNPQSTPSEDIYSSATTSTLKKHVVDCSIKQIFSMPEIPTPPEDISSSAVTAPPVLPAQTEYPLQAPVTDAFLDSDPTSSKGSSNFDGEIESSPFRSAGSTIMAGDGEVLPSARASPLSTSAADASLSRLVERASGYGIVSLATEVEASAEHDSEADGTATPPDQLPSSSTSSFSFGSALSSTCKFHPSRLSRAFYMPLALKISWLKENPPLAVLQTARVLARRNILSYRFPLENLGNYYVAIYFAGVLPVSSVFDVLVNGNVVNLDYHVRHAEVSSIVYLAKAVDKVKVSFRNVSFYPQVNGIELYEVVKIPPECSATTVSALQVIQQSTGFDLGWEDDPCSPTTWSHIGCNGSLVTSLELSDVDLRIISPTFGDLLNLKKLDLHNTSLTGEIMNLGSLQELEVLNLSFNMLTSFGSEFGTMVSLKILDLQNNSIEGPIPDSLGTLKDLHFLNLENNKLHGVLPQSLNKKSLEIRTSGNLCLAFSVSSCDGLKNHTSIETPQFTVINMKRPSGRTHKTIIIGVVGCFCCALLLITIVLFIFWKKRGRRNGLLSKSWMTREIKNWCTANIFTYKEIKAATNNFKDIIGTGGFGSVYLGKLSDGKLVAVKVRLDKTQLGADSFINEVHVLSRIRHQNLVSLEGFCYESKQQILVYEYLPSGSLADNLYGSNSKNATLNWARRLKIAIDAAKGLEHLHNGSNPRIIHRDIKCSNILLDLDMNAKVADFGLSRQIPQPEITHITTAIKGTAGYLDPEYYATQQLTEKSDVYSFGVVLLELICGREPLSHAGAPDTYNLVLWAKPYLQAGALEIVDENLKGGFDVESMKKVASIAVKCVEREAAHRPTMSEVLIELKEAYSIQLTFLSAGGLY